MICSCNHNLQYLPVVGTLRGPLPILSPLPAMTYGTRSVPTTSKTLFQRLGAADDFRDFLGDLRLASAVVLSGQVFDDIPRGFRGRLHNHAASDMFPDRHI